MTVLPPPTPTASSSSATASPEAAPPTAGAAEETSGVPSWLWWLLGVLAVAVATAVLLVARRRRQAWEAGLAAALDEVTWLARVLVPQLRLSGSAEQVRGGWAVSADRVRAAEDQLTALEATARREEDRTRARTLRDVVRASSDRIEAVAAGAVADIATELGRVVGDLEGALAAVAPSPEPGTPASGPAAPSSGPPSPSAAG